MKILDYIGGKLGKNKFPMVGLDISDNSIEFMQLERGFKKPKIKKIYRLELESGLISNNRIKEIEKVAAILQSAFLEAKLPTNSCLLCLPDKETYFVTLKSSQAENIKQEIYQLAQENLPIDLSSCYWDFCPAGEGQYFFAAAPKDIIEQYIELFKLSGLMLEIIDFESACLARTLIDQTELIEGLFILDLGAKSTDLILVDKNGFTDQINFAAGGFFISQKIAEKLNKDFSFAENLKKEKGIELPEINAEQFLEEMFAPIVAEINKMSAIYQQKTGKDAKRIILAGGTSLLKGLKEFFEKKLPGYQIEFGQIAGKIDFSEDLLKGDKILYANVIGLALRGLNRENLSQGINLRKDFQETKES